MDQDAPTFETSGADGLVTFDAAVKGTELRISALKDLTGPAEDLLAQALWQIESYVRAYPRFAETWAPIDVPSDAPDIIRAMARAAHLARVGPTAAQAGVIAEYVARGLRPLSEEVTVEMSGDVYMVGKRDRTVVPKVGVARLGGHMALKIRPSLLPLAVCTSTRTDGHTDAPGAADAATVMAHDGALADAVATALANRVHSAEDIQRALDACRGITGVLGLLVVAGDHLGAWGNIRLTALG